MSDLLPVKTIFAFNARKAKGTVEGRFECLALAPASSSSGEFTQNVMYVTGTVMELERHGGSKAVIKGTARITGLGAGESVPFEATVEEGQTGATFSLTVDSLPNVVFREIVTAGGIRVE